MDRIETAVLLFNQGFNCAQALVSTYGTELGLDRDTALRLASPFGGGMARRGDTCGAVTGAFMIIGLRFGSKDAKDTLAKDKTHKAAERFINEFQSLNRSVTCRDLLGFDLRSVNINDPEMRNIFQTKCTKFIHNSAEILEGIL